MSNWAQTCNYCGAPLQGARCPRCSFERKPFGEVVLSGYVSGPSFPIQYDPIGTSGMGGGPTITLTFPNVACAAGTLLCCYTTAVNDGSLAIHPTVTWGATSLTLHNPGGDGVILTGVFDLLITSANAGTRTLTVTITDASVEYLAAIAFRLIGAASHDQGAHQNFSGTGDPDTITTNVGSSNPLPNLLAVYFAMNYGGITDTGDWLAPATEKLGVMLQSGLGDLGWVSQGIREYPTGFVIGQESTRQLSAPVSDWFVDGNLYK